MALKPPDNWKPNHGRRPNGSKGKRCRVKLRHSGEEPVYDDHFNSMSPPGWAVDTTRWTLLDDPFDVTDFIIL